MDEVSCANCTYVGKGQGLGGATCRRHPPKVLVVEDKAVSYFPHINISNGWCGEYVKKAEDPTKSN